MEVPELLFYIFMSFGFAIFLATTAYYFYKMLLSRRDSIELYSGENRTAYKLLMCLSMSFLTGAIGCTLAFKADMINIFNFIISCFCLLLVVPLFWSTTSDIFICEPTYLYPFIMANFLACLSASSVAANLNV